MSTAWLKLKSNTERSRYIETQNAAIKAGQIAGAHAISLESVLIGNGWYDPKIQYAAYYNITVSPGNTYDISIYDDDEAKTGDDCPPVIGSPKRVGPVRSS